MSITGPAIPPLTSKTALVTGGTGCFGKEIVAELLRLDIRKVVVLARNLQKFEQAKVFWKD
jgi:NAD(P)-dependent dehydrogenase (short-subunit alcohol dehydrogenase family)